MDADPSNLIQLPEYTMSIKHCVAIPTQETGPKAPAYPRTPMAVRIGVSVLSAITSATLLGGTLALFELDGRDAAVARASKSTVPNGPGIAVREVTPRARG